MAAKKLTPKMQQYAQARANGLRPLDAAAHAGYSGSGLRVTTSNLEARADIRAEVRRLKASERGDAPATEPQDDGVEGWALRDTYDSSLDLLRDVYNNPKAPKSIRYQAAKDALPYEHARKEGGKKESDKDRAHKAASGGGKYAPQSAPGKRVN